VIVAIEFQLRQIFRKSLQEGRTFCSKQSGGNGTREPGAGLQQVPDKGLDGVVETDGNDASLSERGIRVRRLTGACDQGDLPFGIARQFQRCRRTTDTAPDDKNVRTQPFTSFRTLRLVDLQLLTTNLVE